MKTFRFLALFLLASAASSCAFFNSKTVDLAINSNPPGADIFIEGRSYGVTPTVIKIEPKKYIVTLTKEGYGSAVFNTETWGTIRTDVNGESNADGKRCLLDTVSVIFFFNVFTQNCADFKQKEYFINIPRTGAAMGNGAGSLIGIGNKPNNMIDYYYGGQGMPQANGNGNSNQVNGGNNSYMNPYSGY